MAYPLRKPAVAGRFYPSDPLRLRRDIQQMMDDVPFAGEVQTPRALLLPHAGYLYSGPVVAAVLRRVCLNPRLLILGPNHHQALPLAVLDDHDAWETPLGKVLLDDALREELSRDPHPGGLVRGHAGTLREHALEVLLPFLQVLGVREGVVPLTIGWGDWEALTGLADHLADRLDPEQSQLLISSDMTHQETKRQSRDLEMPLLEAMERIDAKAFYREIHARGLSVCGWGPITLALLLCRHWGCTRFETCAYCHSSRVTGAGDAGVSYLGGCWF